MSTQDLLQWAPKAMPPGPGPKSPRIRKSHLTLTQPPACQICKTHRLPRRFSHTRPILPNWKTNTSGRVYPFLSSLPVAMLGMGSKKEPTGDEEFNRRNKKYTEGINNKLDNAEEQISDLEDRVVESSQAEQQEEERIKRK